MINWKKFKNQPLKVGDLLWLEKGGLAYVDGDRASEPSMLVSIPEAWTFCLNVKYENIQSGLNSKGELYDSLGDYADRILLYASYPLPPTEKLNISNKYDYVEITFYKEGGKMNFIESLLIPIFLDEIQLREILKEEYGQSIIYNDIVIKGEYYNRLIKRKGNG